MLLLVMPINLPVQACIPITINGPVTPGMLPFGASVMSLDVHRCTSRCFVCGVGQMQHSGCMYVGLACGSAFWQITEHVYATRVWGRCPCFDAFMLHGL